MNKVGIYQWRNIINGKRYFGQSINIKQRKRGHRAALRGDYHRNAALQNAWNKYGEDSFVFEYVEEVENNQLLLNEREIYYIDKYDTCGAGGYNIGSGGYLGNPFQGMSKERLADIGRKHSIRVAGSGNPNYNWEIRKHSKEICRLYEEKEMSVNGLCKKFNCHDGAINNILKENGIKPRNLLESIACRRKQLKNGPKYRADLRKKKDDIIRDYEVGKISRNGIALKYGCEYSTIRTILMESNIYIRSSSEQRAIDEKRKKENITPIILEMHSQNCSVAKMKNKVKAAPITIRKILKENNLVPNPQISWNKKNYSKEQLKDACIKTGSGQQAAKLLGCRASVVFSHLKYNNLKPIYDGKPTGGVSKIIGFEDII